MRHMATLGVVLAALPTLGCLTVYRGTTQDIRVTSSPDHAEAMISGLRCETPCTVRVRRSSKPIDVEIRHGERSVRQSVQPSRAPTGTEMTVAFFSGLLILPGIFDLVSGAAHSPPEGLHADFSEHQSRLEVIHRRPGEPEIVAEGEVLTPSEEKATKRPKAGPGRR